MLKHQLAPPADPARVVVLGANGFIGGTLTRALQRQGVNLLALGRGAFSLLERDAADRLAAVLHPEDSLVVISAQSPCRNPAMMVANIEMAGAVCAALQKRPVAHVIYISSDAVYADGPLPLNEDSPAAPTSLHGAMHLTRELMLLTAAGQTPFACLRPTLVYGAGDPHGGYGPNKFRRLANRGEPILLFGEGEERRDHVDVRDVAALTMLVARYRSVGVLNVATGSVASFRSIAEMAVKLAGKAGAIRTQLRSGPMPHGGYRPFDPAATLAAFPDFRYVPLDEGMARAQQEEFGYGRV